MASVAVIGAGVDGLATARAIGHAFSADIVLFEQEKRKGMGTSSRNSGVVHAGIYYKEGSLKDQFCAPGNELLARYCMERGIPYKRTGKYIIASNAADEEKLEGIAQRCFAHNIPAQMLTRNEVQRGTTTRPGEQVECSAALYVPTTGILDVHPLMDHLHDDFMRSPGERMTVFQTLVTSIRGDGPYEVVYLDAGKEEVFACDVVVNAAGLYATDLAEKAGMRQYKKQILFVKGPYWRIPNPGLHSLIYPVPTEHSLGIHFTLDVLCTSQGRLGPGVEVLPYKSPAEFPPNVYEVKDERHEFWSAAVKYLPQLREEQLNPDQAGIRTQLQAPKPQRDFVIVDELAKPGFINKLFIESPGLTCIFPSADYVVELIRKGGYL